MNHFYTDKSNFFRNSRFVFFQEASEGRKIEAQNLKDKPEGEPIKGTENPAALAFKEAQAGKKAVDEGGNELQKLQGEKGLERALDAVGKNPVAAFIKFREGMPNSPEIREAIGEQLAKRNPDIFLANARFFEKTSGYSKYLETAVTNPKASPACLLAFVKDDVVIAKAVNNLMNTDPKMIATRLKGNPKYADVVAKAKKEEAKYYV